MENGNTVSGFYKAQKGFLITIKLGKIAVRQTQCFLLPEVFALLLVLLTAFSNLQINKIVFVMRYAFHFENEQS